MRFTLSAAGSGGPPRWLYLFTFQAAWLASPAGVPTVGGVKSDDLWRALTRPGFVLSVWPWRSVAYLATTVPVGWAALIVLVVLVGVGVVTAVLVVGIALLLGAVLLGVPLGELERWRLRLMLPAPIRGPHRRPARPGLGGWLATRLREPATWKELGYLIVLAFVLWPADLILVSMSLTAVVLLLGAPLLLELRPGQAYDLGPWEITDPDVAWVLVPVGLVFAALTAYVLALVAGAQAALARYLLGPSAEEELVEVGRSRGRLVDAFEAERRRIERDLHDGAQQRLVALTMNLGEAQLHTPADALAAQPLAQAREHAGQALSELRELIRNIHPKVLSDHGLPAALADVAERCAVPVQVTVALPERLPDPVESAVYFAACEALTNVDKHSLARWATVDCRLDGDTLVLEVTDDGVGGADPAAGTGLTGLADRLAVVDGTVSLSSPADRGTTLRMEIPCHPSR
jgi:signal transduction histidine kinase